jgi:hypothetical protein
MPSRKDIATTIEEGIRTTILGTCTNESRACVETK